MGVIPARGGSKSIPRKNLYPLNGVPLIAYTILAAKASRLDDFIVTTDDDMIREVAEQYGAKVIRRPAELGQDDTPMVPVVQHAVAEYERDGEYVDAVCLLQPTSPLRTAEDIDGALSMFAAWYPCHSLVSVYAGIHPKKCYTSEGLTFALPDSLVYRKQDDHSWTRNGAIFLIRREWLDEGRVFGGAPVMFEMPKTRSIDIDDMEDMAIAEALLQVKERVSATSTHGTPKLCSADVDTPKDLWIVEAMLLAKERAASTAPNWVKETVRRENNADKGFEKAGVVS